MKNDRNRDPFGPWRQGPNGPEHDFWTADKSLNHSLWVGVLSGVAGGCLMPTVGIFIIIFLAHACGGA